MEYRRHLLAKIERLIKYFVISSGVLGERIAANPGNFASLPVVFFRYVLPSQITFRTTQIDAAPEG